ncbi:MAG: microcin ABC transporter ATP-binding protein [Desulfobulbus propionicus]|nr:MAG: microcin ABC transporter ATP-binding protein [Desulfobulbus propionicus]
MPPLLTLDNFSLRFASKTERAANNFRAEKICFTVEEGQTHALVGESGSGKSVTALSILRLVDDVASVKTKGTILFNNIHIDKLSRQEIKRIRGNDIAMIFQEPMTSLNPVYTVGSQLIEPLKLHQQMSGAKAAKRALRLLERTGIDNPEYRLSCYPHQLSGGQRQRVMIAMALACSPRLLIADEPTTALDITIQEQILDLIHDIQQEYAMAVLLITHDLSMVKKRADTVSIMHKGKIVEQGPVKAVFKDPKMKYTRELLSAVPGRRKPRKSKPLLIELCDLTCTYTLRSKRQGLLRRKKSIIRAVDRVDLNIHQNQTLGIVGESGSGKSTLAMCILGLCSYTGHIVYHGENESVRLSTLSQQKFRPYRKEIQIVFQDPYSSLSPRMTVENIIGEGLRVHYPEKTKKERKRLINKALVDVELDPAVAHRFSHEFSGGQRQRIAIARALILRPKLLILDEPTSALDMTIQKQVLDLLERLQNQYHMTYIFISHDLRTIRAIADYIIVMQHGRVVERGEAEDIFAHPQKEYTRALFKAAFQ